MRGVVRRKHQDPVLHGLAKLSPVLTVPERRSHLEVRIIRDKIVAGQEQMVWRRLGRDGQSLALRVAHESNAGGGRDVLDVQAATGGAAKRQVAANRLRFSFNRNDGQVQLAC